MLLLLIVIKIALRAVQKVIPFFYHLQLSRHLAPVWVPQLESRGGRYEEEPSQLNLGQRLEDNGTLSLGRLRPRSAVFFYSTLVRAGRREKHPRSLSSWLIRGKVKRREKRTKISSRKNQLHREEKREGKFPSWGGVEGSQTWAAGSPEAPALGYFFNPPSWDTWGFGWVLSFLKTTKVEKQKTFPSLFLTLPEGAKMG